MFPGGPREHVSGKLVVSSFREWNFLFGARGSEVIKPTVADFGVSKGTAPLVTPAYTPASDGRDGFLNDIFYKLFESVQLEWLARRSGVEGHRF